jgi:serine/threonine protein kinase
MKAKLKINQITDWEQHGYRIEEELGKNSVGGRVTYLATKIETSELVVIKQFQFATVSSSWSDYDAYQSEVAVLRSLQHPGIPAYLDSLETDTGFCLIQEYKQAVPLSQPYRWTLEEIKEVAIAVLEVLVYLQQQQPIVIHRDLKPENILIDRSEVMKIYVVDFGFARLGGGEVAVSSVVKGTLGFMPPEQMFNRQLTKASDLYSLGATLICLLTGTKSQNVGQLIDHDSNCFSFRSRLCRLNPPFLDWLERMVSSNPKNRFADAQMALTAFRPIPLHVKNQVNSKNSKTLERIILLIVAAIALKPSLAIVAVVAEIFPITDYMSYVFPAITNLPNLPYVSVSPTETNALDEQRLKSQLIDFASAKCVGCNLQGLYLPPEEVLSRSDLGRANLKNAELIGTDISDSYLDHANMQGAKLNHVNLSGSALNEARLQDADLENADLQGTYLTNANLTGANLTGANLAEAKLHGADFRGANLTDAILPEGYRNYHEKYQNTYFTGAIMPDGSKYKP